MARAVKQKRSNRRRKRAHQPAKPAAPRAGRVRVRGHLVTTEELAKLRDALREAQETLNAIRSGEVDAVVVSGSDGNKIYSLAGAEQPYRIYVERMQEGAVTVSPAGLILYCNQRFAGMLDQPLEKVIGTDFRAHLPPAMWSSLAAVGRDDGEFVKLEHLLQRPTRAPLPVMLTASLLPLEGQNVVCLVVTDLTEQKQNSELQLAKEVAEKASAAKDAFLAALSHELRTPLNPALMRAIALEQDAALPEPLREDLHLIRRNIELEARLIDDLLDLTRIAQGKLQLHFGSMELNPVVRRALEICEAEIRARELNVEIDCAATADRTVGDAIRLQQAVWNLITNSAKFTPKGGHIRIITANPRDRWMSISVRDDGVGFSPGDAAKLFEAFEQGSKEITRQFGGLGLGLAITRSIVLAHGGTVTAHSDGQNRGAAFTIELPLRPDSSLPSLERSVTALRQLPVGMRILLVEDHRDTRHTMETILRRDNFNVISAGTAREALALAEQQTFDVLIADLGLPDRSGLDLMKELGSRFGIRGIATSGYGMEEDIAQCRAAGFDYHLTKPVRIAQLRTLLADLSALIGKS